MDHSTETDTDTARGRARPSASAARRAAVLTPLLVALAAAVGCGRSDPFGATRVSGDVRYGDDALLECPGLRLSFYPLRPPRDPRTHPRPGAAVVDVRTGRFTAATTRTPDDGLVRGRHKVTLRGADGLPLPIDVAGAEYADPVRTPLEVDTDDRPFRIRVRRPAVVAVRGGLVYEDGSPVLVPDAVCGFFVPHTDRNLRSFREIGTATVDGGTGRFASVSRADGDGLFAGTYRVTIRAADGRPLPATAVPAQYADPRTTPLSIDTASAPLTLTIPRP